MYTFPLTELGQDTVVRDWSAPASLTRMEASITMEETKALSKTFAVTETQSNTSNSSPEHRAPTTRKPKTPLKDKMGDSTLDKYSIASDRSEAENRHRAAAQLKAFKAERRKLRLHYIRKLKERLRRMEEAIKKENADNIEPAVPLDQVVMEVIRNLEESKMEKIDQELQKHLDGIQALCAKLRK